MSFFQSKSKIAFSQRIKNLPVSVFSIVMGLTGFAILIQRLSEYNQSLDWLGAVILSISSIVLAVLSFLYGFKSLQHTSSVRAELDHPVKRNFIPTISISLILQSIAYMPHNPKLSLWLWATGVAIQLALSLIVIGRWLWRDDAKPEQLNPAWFIPAVGNMLVPVAGMPLGFVDISWFFFSVGLLFWIILLGAFFYRGFFHSQLPEKLRPTLFIMIAPPAVMAISLSKLSNESLILIQMAFYVSLFFLMLLIANLKYFLRTPFYLSWWAYSFPLAAFAIASVVVHKLTQQTFYLTLAW